MITGSAKQQMIKKRTMLQCSIGWLVEACVEGCSFLKLLYESGCSPMDV